MKEVGLWKGGVFVCVSVCMEWGVRVWKGDEEVDLWGGGVPNICMYIYYIYIYMYRCIYIYVVNTLTP